MLRTTNRLSGNVRGIEVGRYYDPLTAIWVLNAYRQFAGFGDIYWLEQLNCDDSPSTIQLKLEAELEPFFEWIRNNRKEREED